MNKNDLRDIILAEADFDLLDTETGTTVACGKILGNANILYNYNDKKIYLDINNTKIKLSDTILAELDWFGDLFD